MYRSVYCRSSYWGKYFLDYLCRCSGEEKVNLKHAMLLPININKALAATRKSQFLRDRRI